MDCHYFRHFVSFLRVAFFSKLQNYFIELCLFIELFTRFPLYFYIFNYLYLFE